MSIGGLLFGYSTSDGYGLCVGVKIAFAVKKHCINSVLLQCYRNRQFMRDPRNNMAARLTVLFDLMAGLTAVWQPHVSWKSCIIQSIRGRLWNSWSVSTFVCHMHQKFSQWSVGVVTSEAETRDRFGEMGRFKGRLKCKGFVNSVIMNVITEIHFRYNYMQVFFKYKYNVKICMYTISTLF